MDNHSQFPQIRRLQTKHKKRLTQDQIRLLETNFSFNNKLDADRKSQLAIQLGVAPRQVAIWYQNKRAREKNQSLEADYKSMQLRLDGAVADNARLRGEVERLRAEVERMRSALNSFNSPSSGDEVGEEGLILERELYDSLIGGGAGAAFGAPELGYHCFGSSMS